jgi:MraZ protein
MTQFVGTHINKLDAKGRVSIPASFRAALKASETTTLILRPSHKFACIEAWAAPTFHALATPMQRMEIFSDDTDDLAFALYADAAEVDAGDDGRIVLPNDLIDHAGLAVGAITFVGIGTKFEIWEPTAAERRREQARARARGLTLPGRSA